MSWLAAGVSGLFDLLGGGLNAAYNAAAARKNYEYNMRLQDDAQAHQIYMYQNQHQWRVNDLRAAGLNPILATHAGSSMPSVSASHSAISAPANFDFSNSARAIERAIFEKGQKEVNLLDAQISSAKSVAESNKALAAKYSAEANNIALNTAFDFDPEVIQLKKRQLKYNSTGRFGKEFGIVDEVNPFSPDSSSALGKKIDQDNYKREQFNKIFPNEMRKQYKKSFPFLFK